MDYIITTKQLTKKYKNFISVNKISMHIKRGSIYGFLGPNGAGKSTTMKMLLGLTAPTSGSFVIDGRHFPDDRLSILKKVGSFIESPSFYANLTGRENLDIICRILGLPGNAVDDALKLVGLTEFGNRLAKKYSLGMKQRLGLAGALLGRPPILILDEPTNGLDPSGIHEIRNLIKSLPGLYDCTVLISSHMLSEIELIADDIGILNHGRMLFEGSLDELRQNAVQTGFATDLEDMFLSMIDNDNKAIGAVPVRKRGGWVMNTLIIELRKEKRTGVIPLLLSVGILGAAYAFVNFIVRKDTLLNLPLDPMDVFLTQLYGMIMVLNMFGIVTAACMVYSMEFKGTAIKKMYMLPVSVSRMYLCKFLILTVLLLTAIVLQNLALLKIGISDLPQGAFKMGALLSFTAYSFITSMPVLSFMVLISSRFENMWMPLGIGVAGFLSGMALANANINLLLIHPFVVMLKPAVAMSARPDNGVAIISLAETFLFSGTGLWMAKYLRYE